MYAQQIELFLMQFEGMLFEQHLQRMEFQKATLEDSEEKELIIRSLDSIINFVPGAKMMPHLDQIHVSVICCLH